MYEKWFECKVLLTRTFYNGVQKQVKEVYIVDAQSCTEAEARILEELEEEGDVKPIGVVSVKRCEADSIVDLHEPKTDFEWYKAKVALFSVDESAGKEKMVYVILYVRGKDVRSALTNTETYLKGLVTDSIIVSIAKTNIVAVYEHKKDKQINDNEHGKDE